MFLRESVQSCPRCAEVTPHSRRVIAVPAILGLVVLAMAGGCLLRGDLWTVAALPLLLLGAFVFLKDREQSWSIHCERCRGRQRLEVRRQKPKLDGNTEINLF
jgi:hypothetical protein